MGAPPPSDRSPSCSFARISFHARSRGAEKGRFFIFGVCQIFLFCACGEFSMAFLLRLGIGISISKFAKYASFCKKVKGIW